MAGLCALAGVRTEASEMVLGREAQNMDFPGDEHRAGAPTCRMWILNAFFRAQALPPSLNNHRNTSTCSQSVTWFHFAPLAHVPDLKSEKQDRNLAGKLLQAS